MSYGKMRTPVQLLSSEAVKDAEGFATQQPAMNLSREKGEKGE